MVCVFKVAVTRASLFVRTVSLRFWSVMLGGFCAWQQFFFIYDSAQCALLVFDIFIIFLIHVVCFDSLVAIVGVLELSRFFPNVFKCIRLHLTISRACFSCHHSPPHFEVFKTLVGGGMSFMLPLDALRVVVWFCLPKSLRIGSVSVI